jgi:hypothetical protein
MTIYGQVAFGNNPAGVNSDWLDSGVAEGFAANPDLFPVEDLNTLAFFEEEEVTSIEFGIKGTYAEKMTYALSFYHLDWTNYTERFDGLNYAPSDFVDLDNNGTGDVGTAYEGQRYSGNSYLGAGDVTGQGIEFESSIILTDELRAGVAAAWTDITYDDGACNLFASLLGVDFDESIQLGDETLGCNSIAGKEVATQPKFAASFSLDYKKQLDNGMEWFTRWSTQYTGSQYLSSMNLAKLDAFSVSDIRTGLGTDAWNVEFYVTNLFDEDSPQGMQYHWDGEADLGVPGPPFNRANLVYTERRGTSFGLRFGYNFGG